MGVSATLDSHPLPHSRVMTTSKPAHFQFWADLEKQSGSCPSSPTPRRPGSRPRDPVPTLTGNTSTSQDSNNTMVTRQELDRLEAVVTRLEKRVGGIKGTRDLCGGELGREEVMARLMKVTSRIERV